MTHECRNCLGVDSASCLVCGQDVTHEDAVEALLDEAIGAHLNGRIAYHGPYGATSEEQWTWDAERQFVHELQDGGLRSAVLTALLAPENRETVLHAIVSVHGLGETLAALGMEQVGWHGPYGIVPGGLDVDPAPDWRPVYVYRGNR